jgi:co-chaperonin GroES (HSP10)|tara:strand:- start:47 stop:331 length:285 start_codon:yes stop_codon:yes gene_type:complete
VKTKTKRMNFKPNGSWVLLPNPAKRETNSGIILDDATVNKLKTNILKVLAAGPNCTFCKEGDTVMIDPRGEGVVTEIEGVDYVMIMEHQILGIM